MDSTDYDVIVVGAGVAGGALATSLARDGRSILLLERELWAAPQPAESDDTVPAVSTAVPNDHATKTTTPSYDHKPLPSDTAATTRELFEPERIVGELLQPGGCAALARLGLSDALEGIDAQHVYGYGVFLGDNAECLRYTADAVPDDDEDDIVAGTIFTPSRAGRTRARINRALVASRNRPLEKVPRVHAPFRTPVEGNTYESKEPLALIPTPDPADRLRRRAIRDAPSHDIAVDTKPSMTANTAHDATVVACEPSVLPNGHPVVSGRSFHNGRFLRRLREIAREQPNVTLVEGNVTSLDKDPVTNRVIGVSYHDRAVATKTANGNQTATTHKKPHVRHARAKYTIVCDGCASNLRKRAAAAAPAPKVDVYSMFVALVLHVPELPFPNHGHVVLADPAPILFYPISSTEVRCLVDIPSTVTKPVRDHMLDNLAPQVPDALRGPFVDAIRAGGFKSMPNRVMPAVPAVIPGAVLLGDSFNMRHPLTGGGMTVALSDVALIRALFREIPDLTDDAAMAAALDVFYEQRRPLSSTINILANALYSVFCATEDPALIDMRDACYEYLCSGGRMSYDPMGMLGGIKPSPTLLVVHFFCVALFGCGRVLLPYPTPTRLAKAWSIFRASFNIVKPLIDAERIFPLHLIPFRAI